MQLYLHSIKNNQLPKLRTLLFIVVTLRPLIGSGSFPATVLHVLSLKISVLELETDNSWTFAARLRSR